MVKKKKTEEPQTESTPAGETTMNQEYTEEAQTEIKESGTEAQLTEEMPTEESLLLKLTEMQEKYLRLSAEFDNYRKRTLREKIELSQAGGESLLIKLLPVIDDFDRAVVSMRSTDNCDAVKEGLELIYNKVYDFLRQAGVSEITALNEPFNGDLHEAVSTVSVEEMKLKGKVIDITQKGYTLNEKVIRYPRVIVGE